MLNNDSVISVLGESFINSWVLAKNLDDMAEASDDDRLKALCRIVQDNYGYPVDTVLVSSTVELLGHKNVNDAMYESPAVYVAFLRKALGEDVEIPDEQVAFGRHEHEGSYAGPADLVAGLDAGTDADLATAPYRTPPPLPAIVLTPDSPSGSVLDVFETLGPGRMRFRLVDIDTTAFIGGGRLEIVVTVGGMVPKGTFELMRQAGEGWLEPIADVSDVKPGESGKIVYDFRSGEVFQFGARGSLRAEAGLLNAFQAELVVKSNAPVLR